MDVLRSHAFNLATALGAAGQRTRPGAALRRVAVHVDGQWLILDNRTLTLVRDMDLTRAVPELVLDHEGVKRFVRTGHSHGTTKAT